MAQNDPWVGTWRPHQPRGPISALFGSPGPKYVLPPLTGDVKHDITKYKAPNYTMGARRKIVNTDCSPGPKYQLPSTMVKYDVPGQQVIAIRGRLKEPKVFQGPGPGQYSPENSERMTYYRAPAYSLYGKGKDEKRDQIPGPTAYNLPSLLGQRSSTTTTAPAYTLVGRSKDAGFRETNKNPGPAAYKAVNPSVYRQKLPQYSMTGRNFAPDDKSRKPGPGEYSPEQVTLSKTKAPSYSFGVHHSRYVLPVLIKPEEC